MLDECLQGSPTLDKFMASQEGFLPFDEDVVACVLLNTSLEDTDNLQLFMESVRAGASTPVWEKVVHPQALPKQLAEEWRREQIARDEEKRRAEGECKRKEEEKAMDLAHVLSILQQQRLL